MIIHYYVCYSAEFEGVEYIAIIHNMCVKAGHPVCIFIFYLTVCLCVHVVF